MDKLRGLGPVIASHLAACSLLYDSLYAERDFEVSREHVDRL